MRSSKEENELANKLFSIFLLVGIIPLVVIFAISLHNVDSSFLKSIADKSHDLPNIISAKQPLMTKVMDTYCKSAPFLALILFAISINLRKIKTKINRAALIRSCFISPFLYIIFMYFILFSNLELTTAGRPWRLLSGNDSSLLLVYISLYSISFCLTYGICLTPLIAYKLYKERR